MASFANILLPALILIAPVASAAFDSEAWLQKREVLSREAERLEAAYAKCLARVVDPAKDVTIPVETFPDGSVKTSVVAKKAMLFLDSSLVWAENVCVRQYDEAGQVVAQIDAHHCVIDRSTKSGWAEGRARLRQQNTIFEGEGVYFSSPERYVSVRENSQLDVTELKSQGLMSSLPASSLKTGAAKSARITSRRSDFDREEGVVLFEGDAVVTYASDYTLTADRIFAFLDEENQLTHTVALGQVNVVNGTRSGQCPRARFVKGSNEVEMFGDDKMPAQLKEAADGHVITGSKIRFWLDSEQVEVSDSRMTVSKGEKGVKLL